MGLELLDSIYQINKLQHKCFDSLNLCILARFLDFRTFLWRSSSNPHGLSTLRFTEVVALGSFVGTTTNPRVGHFYRNVPKWNVLADLTISVLTISINQNIGSVKSIWTRSLSWFGISLLFWKLVVRRIELLNEYILKPKLTRFLDKQSSSNQYQLLGSVINRPPKASVPNQGQPYIILIKFGIPHY